MSTPHEATEPTEATEATGATGATETSGVTEPTEHTESVGQETPAGADPERTLRELGWPLSGHVDPVLATLRAGRGVDIDNAAGWPLPNLGPSAEPARSDAVARVLVTDMAAEVALELTPGLPTLVISAPSLVVGVDADEGAGVDGLVEHVLSVLSENLLARESVVALAAPGEQLGRSAVSEASAQLGVPVLGFDAENVAAAGGKVTEAVVTLAGARSVLPENSASSREQPGTRVAVGRLSPVPHA